MTQLEQEWDQSYSALQRVLQSLEEGKLSKAEISIFRGVVRRLEEEMEELENQMENVKQPQSSRMVKTMSTATANYLAEFRKTPKGKAGRRAHYFKMRMYAARGGLRSKSFKGLHLGKRSIKSIKGIVANFRAKEGLSRQGNPAALRKFHAAHPSFKHYGRGGKQHYMKATRVKSLPAIPHRRKKSLPAIPNRDVTMTNLSSVSSEFPFRENISGNKRGRSRSRSVGGKRGRFNEGGMFI